ncbi:carbamoyltransferase [Nemorincola caseinilytica]|uniref:Carbamoyltransferase n=1 Tax=Nemorincola caseinilytica TaxID=2054315 RepID=A0ABP8NJA1_9BACT
MQERKILGISCFYHDSAAALTVGGRIIAAAQEERFTREKHTAAFPANAIRYCLEEAGLRIDELDAVVFYDKPLLKLERLLQTYYAFAPRGLLSFLRAIPVWLREKIFLKKLIRDGLEEVEPYDRKQLKLLFTEHHLSHAASAFFPSPYERAAILTIDGVGEWCTASIGVGEGNRIRIVREMEFPHSVGLLYSAFTYYLGFAVNGGEYKLMGLAPYGDPGAERTVQYMDTIKKRLVDVKEDGSVWMDQGYFSYATGLRMAREDEWERLFGFPRREEDAAIEQHHCDLALAIQTVTEEIVIKMAREVKRITGADDLCMAGGVALNCVANGKLLREGIFSKIYVQPAAGDAGGALGAALAAAHMYYEEPRMADGVNDQMNGSYLGPQYSDKEVMQMNRRERAVYKRYDNFENLTADVAARLANGEVVGWYQGRMEYGPRALGNRSILADARDPEMQKRLNLRIKNREGFRPFAPAVLVEDATEYFELETDSSYMLMVAQVRRDRCVPLPEGFHGLPLWDKLYQKRSDIQAVTHVDGSARIQTVHRGTNERYRQLINAFKQLTGYGLLVNTSFNVRDEPVVCTPYDAYRCFMATDMDVLVMNEYVYLKSEQPERDNKDKWKSMIATI